MILFGKLLQRLYKWSGSQYYLDISPQIFYTNWIFQKIYGNHTEVPHPVHFSTLVTGYNNIRFNKKDQSILKSFAVSGGCYIGIANGSTLEIGDNTIWAWNINIQTANHDF